MSRNHISLSSGKSITAKKSYELSKRTKEEYFDSWDYNNLCNIMEFPESFNDFESILFRLIMKADKENKELLRLGFPLEVKTVERILGTN